MNDFCFCQCGSLDAGFNSHSLGTNSVNGASMLSHSSFRNEKFLANSMPKAMKEIRGKSLFID